jgi:hypothetical protein
MLPGLQNTTKKILDAQLAIRARMYNAYVELQGVVCKWYKVEEGETRLDFYGDIKSPNLNLVADTISVVLPLGDQVVEFLSNYDKNITSEEFGKTISGHVKIDSAIQVGDRIVLELRHFNSKLKDIKVLEVMAVEGPNSPVETSRTVRLAPATDNLVK